MPEPKFTRGWPNATHRFLALFSIYILNTDLVALDRFNNSSSLIHALSERKKAQVSTFGRNWLKPRMRSLCPLKIVLTRLITPSVSILIKRK